MPFLSLIPIKDWIYLGAIVALLSVFGWYTVHERHIGAQHELEAVQKASAKTQAEAQAQIDELDKSYTATLAAVQEKQDEQLKTAAATAADLSSRLRNYEAHNRACPVLPGTAAPAASGVAAPDSVTEAVAGVIAAAEHDLAVIDAERQERDALTGK